MSLFNTLRDSNLLLFLELLSERASESSNMLVFTFSIYHQRLSLFLFSNIITSSFRGYLLPYGRHCSASLVDLNTPCFFLLR